MGKRSIGPFVVVSSVLLLIVVVTVIIVVVSNYNHHAPTTTTAAAAVQGNSSNSSTSRSTANGGAGADKTYSNVGNTPDASQWSNVSVMITGEILATLDPSSTTLQSAMDQCHQNPRCTHVDVWPNTPKPPGTFYLKNANSLPAECLNITARCSDGDWKTGGGWGLFHPGRDWNSNASTIESALKEEECSSGSPCATTEILNWLSVGMVPFDLLGQLDGIGDVLLGTTFARIAMISGDMSSASDVSQGAINVAMLLAKQKGTQPYSNRPFIDITDWNLGCDTLGTTDATKCKGGGGRMWYEQRAYPCDNGHGTVCIPTDTNIRGRISDRANTVFVPWDTAYNKWTSLPYSTGNYDDVNWKALYTSGAGLKTIDVLEAPAAANSKSGARSVRGTTSTVLKKKKQPPVVPAAAAAKAAVAKKNIIVVAKKRKS